MGRIGIIGAMEEEIALLKEKMEIEVIVKKASMEFYQGTLNGREIVVVRSGIGKVNAGLCAQILIDVFHVNRLINTGIAGSLKADIDIGDIVISSDALQHDMDARNFGYARGEIPRMDTVSFPADSDLISIAKTACEEANPDIKVFVGRIVTGDQFIAALHTGPRYAGDKDAMCLYTLYRVLHGLVVQYLKRMVFKGEQFCQRDFLHVPVSSRPRRLAS